MKRKIILITFILFVFDQITKFIVQNSLINKVIIKGFLKFIYVENEGVAFSFLTGKRIIIIIISFVLLYFIINMINKEYISKKIDNNYYNIMYGMLLAGVFGNLFDRIIRGYVIDFISINIFGYLFPIFNVADIFITLSVSLIIIGILFKKVT